MHIKSIAAYFTKLPTKQRQRFSKNMSMLFQLERMTLSLRGPFRIILDSNILMRIEDIEKGIASEGLLAVLCFFDYFKTQNHYKADLLIRPPVFYEYCRHQPFGSLSNHWEKFKDLRTLVERELGTEVLFDDITNFSEAEATFKLIERDASHIRKKLISIANQDWRYNFVKSFGDANEILQKNLKIEVPPYFAANHLFDGISTEYFNPKYVALFLKDHIGFALANNEKNDLAIAKNYKHPNNYILRKVLFLNAKQELRGLADIDILSTCNTQAQFQAQAQGQYWPASVPLTVDENLYLSLRSLASHGVTSEPIMGGESQSEIRAKIESSFDDARRRMDRAREQQERCKAAQNEYTKSIAPLFSTEA